MRSLYSRVRRLEKKTNSNPQQWEFVWRDDNDPPDIYRGKDGRQYRRGSPDWPKNAITFVYMDMNEL